MGEKDSEREREGERDRERETERGRRRRERETERAIIETGSYRACHCWLTLRTHGKISARKGVNLSPKAMGR